MAKDTKEKKRYIIINIILSLIILTLIAYIYLLIKNNKQKIINGYEYSINVIVSTLQLEKNSTETSSDLSKNKESIEVPIDKDIFDNKEYNFNEVTNNKYYYSQLDNNAKIIYDSIEDNLNNMKSGTYQIKLPNEVANILKKDNGEEILDKSFQSAWDAISLDRMDMLFLDVSKISLSIKKTIYGNKVSYSLAIVPQNESGYLEDGFKDETTVDLVLNEIKNSRNNLINSITAKDTYNTILQVHDWIINNIEYSLNIQDTNVYNLYGAFIQKSAVCEGYAESFKYVLDELGIPCILVSGEATNSNGITENHAWNYVKINEKWYAVDTTWDDPILKGFGYISNATKHKYFLQGSKTMNENHTTRGKITETGQEFIYPELEKNAYKK